MNKAMHVACACVLATLLAVSGWSPPALQRAIYVATAYAKEAGPIGVQDDDSREEYDREHSRNMLPGWDAKVFRWYSGMSYDPEHPDGEGFTYEVTNVTSSNPDVVRVTREEWENDGEPDHNWRYEALSHGTATLEVTHTRMNGQSTSYTFDVQVVSDVYEVQVHSDDWTDYALPGSTVELHAEGVHHREGAEATDEGLTYEWKVVEGADVGTLVVDPQDPQHARFEVNSPSAEKMGFDDLVHIRVYLYADGEESVANSGWAFEVENIYNELWPTYFERRLPVGGTAEVYPELREYCWGENEDTGGYLAKQDAKFQWKWVDEDAVSITDAEGNNLANGETFDAGTTCTIRRLRDWGTSFALACTYTDWQGNEQYTERHYELDEMHFNLWFEGAHDVDVWVTRDGNSYSDAANPIKTVSLSGDLKATEGADVSFTVGTWNNDSWETVYDTSSNLYTVSDDGLSITANGTEMARQGVQDLRVIATATAGEMDPVNSDNDFWFHLRERECRYDLEHDRDMLPGWEGTVEGVYNVHVRDEEHPDGENFDCEVTNVEVVDGAEHLEDFRKESDQNGRTWWRYQAKDHGVVTVKTTYKDLGGTEQTHTFSLNITDKVFSLDVWQEPQSMIMAGQSVELHAQGRVQREEGHTIREGLSYRWELEPSEDYTLVVDENDPSHATLTFRGIRDGESPRNYYCEAWPTAVLYELDDKGNEVERARNDLCTPASASFILVDPSTIDRELDVMESTTIDPKIVFRHVDQTGNVVDEVLNTNEFKYYWSFDENAVRVTNAKGEQVVSSQWGANDTLAGEGPYTITRLSKEHTMLGFMTRWSGPEGQNDQQEMRYILAAKDYEVWFDANTYTTSEDCSAALRLDVSRVSGMQDYANDIDLHIGSNWNGQTHTFENELGKDEYTIDKDQNVWTISVPGSVLKQKLADWNCDRLNVSTAFIPQSLGLTWVDGTSVSLAQDSTHALRHYAAKEATTTTPGNKEYWQCDNCHKVFLDEAATRQTTMADVMLPVLFTDVTDKTAHEDDINWLAVTGISQGWVMSDGTRQFRPYNNVARADMAAFLFRLAKNWGTVTEDWQPSGEASFEDVTEKTAHYREIMWLAETGISQGWTVDNGKKEFRPLANVARADMAAFIARLWRLAGHTTEGSKDFLDVTDKTAHAEDIRWLAAAGISQGWPNADGTASFRPYANVARADMAAFLHRLDGLQQ